jgi:hypothetical protein
VTIRETGTGKTLLALAAGLEQVLGRTTYRHLLISRPTFPMARTSAICRAIEKLNRDAADLRQPGAPRRPPGAVAPAP